MLTKNTTVTRILNKLLNVYFELYPVIWTIYTSITHRVFVSFIIVWFHNLYNNVRNILPLNSLKLKYNKMIIIFDLSQRNARSCIPCLSIDKLFLKKTIDQ